MGPIVRAVKAAMYFDGSSDRWIERVFQAGGVRVAGGFERSVATDKTFDWKERLNAKYRGCSAVELTRHRVALETIEPSTLPAPTPAG